MTASTWRFLRSTLSGLAIVGACTGGVQLVRSGGAVAAPTVRFQDGVQSSNADLSSGTVLITTGGATALQAPAAASPFRDGRYDAVGRYATPGGDESIEVAVQVSGGVVIAADVRTEALSPTALQFQEQFRQHVTVQVVGRNLAEVSVSRVAGASLTSVGFDGALTQIKSAARR